MIIKDWKEEKKHENLQSVQLTMSTISKFDGGKDIIWGVNGKVAQWQHTPVSMLTILLLLFMYYT